MKRKVEKILEKNNYFTNRYCTWIYLGFLNLYTLQGRVNKNKTIRIEPHLELLSPKYRVNV